ncbi:rod shape-determining protein RodA [Nonlabens ulvanivorans]|uniref:Rod shape-determining protein RodA n=1 Tax=Nonlabens ulvanivorans TaxID=906888 RepID=A0A081D8R3_NONUL|nr:rod shape-determining protein RodA [Nonlabens ulvanivorans]GAK99189.1 rod shape-determining protein RodA [Nonlabens ulvanivorans]
MFIIPQPDPGSALVYGAFFFALHREGLSLWYLSLVLVAIGLFLGDFSFRNMVDCIDYFNRDDRYLLAFAKA